MEWKWVKQGFTESGEDVFHDFSVTVPDATNEWLIDRDMVITNGEASTIFNSVIDSIVRLIQEQIDMIESRRRSSLPIAVRYIIISS